MNALWKHATSPNIVEDAARLVFVKHALSAEFGRAVRELQLHFINKTEPICSGEEVDSLCACLEATFIHGIKVSFARKMSSVFSTNSDRMPEPDFWPVVMVYSHKQVLSHITQLNNITTDVGRSRAWLRLALNDGLLKSYIEALIQDKSTLSSYYRISAYLRDTELPCILKQFLEGLDIFHFQLPYNCTNLNIWSPEPLLLAGIWNPPESPEPVMPAEDVVKSLTNESTRSLSKFKRAKRKFAHSSSSTLDSNDDFLVTTAENETSVTNDGGSVPDSSFFPPEISNSAEALDKETNEKCLEQMNDNDSIKSDFQAINISEASSPHSVPGFEHMFIGNESNLPRNEDLYGNKLMIKSGWSSAFETEESLGRSHSESESMFDSLSYDSLFQSYTRNQPSIQVLATTPELGCQYIRQSPERESTPKSPEECSSPDYAEFSEFEIVPRKCAFSSKHMDAATQELFSSLDKICPEKGLDVQQYKCHGCSRPIGMIYGDPLICMYDGYNYCSECHSGETFYIPSRILYNWDFRKHLVSNKAKEFILHIQEEPLIDVRLQNPQLYTVVHELVELQMLRTQLSFLRSYLFTCRQDVAEQLRKMVWPREYLFEHLHLYSLFDLLQIPNNNLIQTLQRAVNFGKKHVLKCTLCSQKGFICEVCNSSKIIYPFETELTFHCEDCLAVYHLSCMNSKKPCPKCQRRKKRNDDKEV